MKIKFNNFNESILKTTNFKDIDNWSVNDILNNIKYKDDKNIKNINLEKINKLLDDFNLYIDFSDSFEYLKKNKILFADEYKYREVRLGLFKNNDVEICPLSVFMGINNYNDLDSCISEAYSYYIDNLSNIEYINKGYLIDDNASDFIDDIKMYVNSRNIKINNDNLDIVAKVSRRLRKDSKVFHYIKENITNYDSLIKRLKGL